MKVIICGAGQVGWQIARHLSGENNDVTVVDNNPELVSRATDTLDVQGVAGFASYPDVLERAGARDADMIIAATYSDEVNMVTCQVAHSVFEIPRKIARLRSQSYLTAIYSDLYRREHMPIDVVISPEREVADAALQRLAAPAAFDTESFLEGKSQLLGILIEEDCPVLNTPLRQLTDLFSTLSAIVVGIRREGTLFAPESGDHISVRDEIYVFTHTEDMTRTLEVFGKTNNKQERIVILGGGNVGLAVAQALETHTERVRAHRKAATLVIECIDMDIDVIVAEEIFAVSQMSTDSGRIGIMAAKGSVKIFIVAGEKNLSPHRRINILTRGNLIPQFEHESFIPGLLVQEAIDIDT